MSLLSNPETNIKYIRLREGAFYIGKDKETPYLNLTGTITNMFYKDEEFEGSPVRKLIVRMINGEDTAQLSLNTDSQNYSTFVSFLKGVDINQPITLHPKVEAGEKDGKAFKKNSLLVSQDGTYAKGYFTKADMHGAPAWKTVKVGKKSVTDKSEYLAFLEDFVTENYIAALKGGALKQEEKPKNKPAAEQEAPVEKLPWED